MITQFNKLIEKQTWDIVYNFPKQTDMMIYRKHHPWLSDHLRTMIMENNVISLKVYNNQRLADDYKKKGNQLISELRSKEISYYSDPLDLQANDLSKCWTILKKIIGRDINPSKRKILFTIRAITVTDNITIANEFSDLFVSICPQLQMK